MRIHALTADRGGCLHYRIRQPLESLRLRGHHCSWGSGFDAETFNAADVIVGQYLHRPGTVEAWAQFKRAGKALVWDVDDDIFEVTGVTGHGNAYDDPTTVPRMVAMIRQAHVVTVSTPALAERYAPFNENVVVLENCIPDWLPEHGNVPRSPERFTITYTGGPSHQEDFQSIAGQIKKVMDARPGKISWRLYGPTSKPVGWPMSWPLEVVPWEPVTEDYLRSLTGTVGIAPLAAREFNAGKSGIKALEYQGRSIVPVVADWPQYQGVVTHGRTGFLCGHPDDWTDALLALVDDPELVAQMAYSGWVAAKDRVQSRHAARWEAAYFRAVTAAA